MVVVSIVSNSVFTFFVVVLLVYHAVVGPLADGFAISLRLIAAVGLANLVTMTSRLDDSIALLEKLLKPLSRFGVNAGAISLAIALMIRSIPQLMSRGGHLVASWKARSARRVGWRIVIPMALAALDDSEQVADAIKAHRKALQALLDIVLLWL